MLLSASVARLCRRDYIRPRQTTPDHPRPNAYMKPSYPTSGSQVRSLDSSEERQVSQGENRNCATSLQASHPIRDYIRVLPGRRRGSRSRLGGEAHPSPVHNPPAPLICLQRGGSSEAHNESLMLSSCRRVDRTGVGHTCWVGRLLLGHTVRQEWWWVGSTGHYEDSTGVRQPVDGVRPHSRFQIMCGRCL